MQCPYCGYTEIQKNGKRRGKQNHIKSKTRSLRPGFEWKQWGYIPRRLVIEVQYNIDALDMYYHPIGIDSGKLTKNF